jgi:hypothetical protein
MDDKIKVGDYHTLEVIKELDFGMYLQAGEDEILIPKRYIPEGTAIGDQLRVFVYRDSEDRLIATTEHPLATVHSFAALRVVDATPLGVFLDWGLEKDLFLPFSEQGKKMIVGRTYLVWLMIDEETDRVIASARLEKYLINADAQLQEGQQVEGLVWEFTELGIKVIIQQKYHGILYHNEVFTELFVGDQIKATIKKIREDGKTDLTLRKKGYDEVRDAKQQLTTKLLSSKGFLTLTDKSTPQEIYQTLQMSKKTFKQAVGGLLKERKIELTPQGIRYIESD